MVQISFQDHKSFNDRDTHVVDRPTCPSGVDELIKHPLPRSETRKTCITDQPTSAADSFEIRPLRLEDVAEKLSAVRGLGVQGARLSNVSCRRAWPAAWLPAPRNGDIHYVAKTSLTFDLFPIALLRADFRVDARSGEIKDNVARFSTSERRWVGRLAGTALMSIAAFSLGWPRLVSWGACLLGAYVGGRYLDATAPTLIDLRGSLTGKDAQNRLLWTGHADGFAYYPHISGPLLTSEGFTTDSTCPNKPRFYRGAAGPTQQSITYEIRSVFDKDARVRLQNFPLATAARLGMGMLLPI